LEKFILLLRFPRQLPIFYLVIFWIVVIGIMQYATTKFVDNLNYAARGGL
jgi:hypothetical protein